MKWKVCVEEADASDLIGGSRSDILLRVSVSMCVEKLMDGASREFKMLICAVGKPFNSSHTACGKSL